jgi:DsbC/DsbD-like thiol-disulfide interchange protein
MILRLAALVLVLALGSAGSTRAAEPGAGPWVKGANAETRLLIGSRPAAEGKPGPIAGIEIKLADGWKTYWRHPGDAGGIPPSFDWSGSQNVADPKVLFPAPERFTDASGDTIGYKKGVVLPIELMPSDPTRPMVIKVAIEYGICRDICIPAQAQLSATLPPGASLPLPPQLAMALARVPRDAASRKPGDPELKGAWAMLSGAKPRITFDVAQDAVDADLFVEAPEAISLPMARKLAASKPGIVRYELVLPSADDARALAHKTLKLTMIDASGAAEAIWTVP